MAYKYFYHCDMLALAYPQIVAESQRNNSTPFLIDAYSRNYLYIFYFLEVHYRNLLECAMRIENVH